MVNFGICAKCPQCEETEPSKYDSEGKLIALASVRCKLTEGGPLLGDSELPENCPYVVEQMVTEDEASDAFADLEDEIKQEPKAFKNILAEQGGDGADE